MENRSRTGFFSSDLGILSLMALALFVLHLLTNEAYGFHRDELALLDDARHLDWGYVAYPPLAPFIGRLSLALFGPTLVGFRVFSALAMSVVMVLSGLMARELGGGRFAQVVSAIAAAIAPIALIQGAMFQYVSLDYFWWVLIAFFTLRLLKSEDPRWWLGIGAAIGLGMMTKYTIAFLIAGLVGAVLLDARRWLKSPWLWAGAALSLLIFLPNLLWQIQHDFISLEFLSAIHARDVEIGRTQGYLLEQFFVSTNPATIGIWFAGLNYYFRTPAGRRFRALGWMFVIPFILLLLAQGRSYYLAPAYPMLLAAGAVHMESRHSALDKKEVRARRRRVGYTLAFGFVLGAVLMLPIAPVGSGWFTAVSQVHDNFVEQIGWPEITETVAEIYSRLPPAERERTAILAGNYGEAGAINLYGPNYGLPEAVSPVNTYWLRGYGDPPPESLIVLGFTAEDAAEVFEDCELAAQTIIPYGVENEESEFHPDVFVCRGPRQPWPMLWRQMQRFG